MSFGIFNTKFLSKTSVPVGAGDGWCRSMPDWTGRCRTGPVGAGAGAGTGSPRCRPVPVQLTDRKKRCILIIIFFYISERVPLY